MKNIWSTSGRLFLLILLAFSSLVMLLILRFMLAGKLLQGYLLWNLILAIVPALISWAVLKHTEYFEHKGWHSAVNIAGFFAWLIFYPNAPYVFTDFIHVINRSNLGYVAAPWLSRLDLLWFDIILNAAFAFVGHFMGLLSMYFMQVVLRKLYGRTISWVAVLPAVILSGIGIHLGRFSRYNSWDMVFHPIDTFQAILKIFTMPSALLFSLAFSFFIAITYIMFYIVIKPDTAAAHTADSRIIPS